MFIYLNATKTAGYSGFVVYSYTCNHPVRSIWMVPGTFFDDWDNQ